MIMLLIIGISMASSWCTYHLAVEELNVFKKEMHCAPIVKVSTMKEAIKQIEINQAVAGVRD
jgi:uncharacterized protein YcfJ